MNIEIMSLQKSELNNQFVLLVEKPFGKQAGCRGEGRFCQNGLVGVQWYGRERFGKKLKKSR